jgi:putative sigma-54 modulation protein
VFTASSNGMTKVELDFSEVTRVEELAFNSNNLQDRHFISYANVNFSEKINYIGPNAFVGSKANGSIVIPADCELSNRCFNGTSFEMVVIKVEKALQIAEIRELASGEVFRAVTEDKDLYASIDKDIDILEGQIRKFKTKKERMLKDSTLKVLEVEAPVREVSDEILKTAYYEIKPMTAEDAKLKLQERANNIFFTFVNVDSGKVNVIFKLKDSNNYGIVEPEV